MQPHQQRVIDEKDELQERIIKLDAFLRNSGAYPNLSEMDKHLLSIQLSTMQAYHAILLARISLF